ncbi:MAG: DEAD/DEAH box helicase [Planctomycetes bacterium]|nr:DEAD/DEAH box helicase [Planctomycetota bacterium]
MSDNQDLDQLSAKELRQLAGEHNIANRSRLAKDELIQAIQSAIGTRGDGSAPLLAPETPGEAVVETPAPAPVEAVAVAEPAAPVVAEPAGQEPEVLDAAAVADLTNPSPSPAPAPIAAPVATEAGGEPSAAAAGEQSGDAGMPGGEGERRRRRRRRRRGRGRRGDELGTQDGAGADQGEAGDNGDGGDEDDGEGEDGDDGAPEATAPESPAPAAPVDATTAAQPQQQQQQSRPDQRDGRGRDQRPRDERQPQDPRAQAPRPRLNGPQRPVSSVLDRLRTFSAGVLELCDPSTPSWAQARLGELLADCGVAPIPCSGLPHPDFHRVVGTVVAAGVTAGEIAEITAPGFALRGDRGDLFPLRKAAVRLAGERDERTEQVSAPTPGGRAWSTVLPAVQPGAVAPVEAREERRDERQREERPRDERREPREDRPRDERRERREDRPRDDRRERREDRPRDERQREERREDRRDDGQIDPVAAEAAPAGEAAPAAVVHPPVPSPGRPPERTHRREEPGEAPRLPLAPRVADELAQLPKAEGFRALGLNEQILADLAAVGWQKPTPIQEIAIPVALSGKDVVGQAQTGTGKTGAYVLPILQRLYSLEGEGPVALVLCPTRELARQVHQEYMRMSGASGARAALIYGGVSMDEQFRALDRKPHVVIGTPGRIIDHMKRRTLDLSRLAVAVLDEADQMLDIGFWPDVNYIIGHTPPSRQMMLFSATFPDPIREMAEKHMRSPERVHIEPERVTVDQVDQKFIAVPRERKNELLAHFIETFNPPQLVVFCKTKHQTDRVAEVLKRKHMSAGAIHGDLPQSRRERTLQDFRGGQLQCLVATNVAARGLDIPSVSHVVNYDVPEMPEEYVHRIGRTARNGAKGVARTFITPEDGQFLLEIEKHIGLLLEEEKVDGFELPPPPKPAPAAAAGDPAAPRLLKPLVGGIRLGRRR